MAAFALALTLDIPSVASTFDAAVGRVLLANLVEHVLGVVGVALLLSVLRDLVPSPTPVGWVRRYGLAVAVLAGLAALFLAAPLTGEVDDFTAAYGRLPEIAGFWALTVAYFGLSLLELARLCLRYARYARRASTRFGLRLVLAGVLVGVLYSAAKIVDVVSQQFDPSGVWARTSEAAATVLLPVGAVAVGVGLLLPVAVSHGTWTWRRASAVLRLTQLHPLWRAVCSPVPQVVLGDMTSRRFGLRAWRDAELLLTRCTIEIRDAALALRPYVNDAVLAAAAEAATSSTDVDAVTEACWLRRAVEVKGRGEPVVPGAARSGRGAADVAGEAAFLARVGRAWTSSTVRGFALDGCREDASEPVGDGPSDGLAAAGRTALAGAGSGTARGHRADSGGVEH